MPLDRDKTGLVMYHKLRALMPPGFRFNKLEQTFYLPAPYNSRVQILQQAAGREQFQAARVRWVWIDEECPESQGGAEIFTEIMARKEPGVDLDILYTFTPTNGIDWSARKLLDDTAQDRYKNVEVFEASIHDAAISHGGFYSDDEIEEILVKYPEHERQARLYGKATPWSGSLYFNIHGLKALLDKPQRDSTGIALKRGAISALVVEEEAASDLKVYSKPKSGRQYIVGADPGGGVGRDSSVATVCDRASLECVAIFSSNRVDPDYFGAEILLLLGIYYNEALLVVESNNHGGTVLSQLKGRYPNLFMRREWSKIDGRLVPEYGWRTDTRTKPRLLDALARALRDELWMPPRQLVDEMSRFVMKSDGKIEAMVGYFDDAVISAGIALQVNYELPADTNINKEDYRIKLSGVTENAPAWMAS